MFFMQNIARNLAVRPRDWEGVFQAAGTPVPDAVQPTAKVRVTPGPSAWRNS